MRQNRQAGNGRLGLIVTLALVGCAIFVLAKVLPVRIKAYEFRESMRMEARMGAVRRTNDEVAKRLMEEAQGLELPLVRKNLRVSRTKSKIIVAAKFEQPIDLKVTTYVFKFDEREEAPLF